jgi:mono/diheme cytochrome c family protein
MWRAYAGSILFATCVALAGVLPGAAQSIGDAGRGLAYAQKTCAECHAVLSSQTASPRLGVATFKAIADTPGMTSIAIRVWLQTPHPTMPNLIIDAGDRDDVIAYIESLKKPR